MKRRFSSIALLSLLVIALAVIPVLALTVSAADGDGTWELVTDVNTLKAGDTLLIACPAKGFVAGDISSQVMKNVSATFSDSTLETVPSGAVLLTLGGVEGAWTFANSNGKLLGATAVKKLAWGSGTTTWSISIDGNANATIQNGTSSYGRMLYNVNSPRFTTYTSNTSSSMLLPQIYRFVETSSTECEHVNTTTTTVDATCTEKGSVTTTCDDCGAVKTEEIAALGHDYVGGECFICGEAEPVEWQLTDIANIKATDVVVITMTKSDGTTYAMSNGNGTGSAPTAVIVTVKGNTLTGDIDDNIKWNISKNGNNLTIYPKGTTAKWLYCANDNNGVRVGTNANKVFTIHDSGYLNNTATSRYLGVYDTKDWRCYTSPGGVNIKDQTLRFYVLNAESKISGAQLQIDDTLAIKYLVTLADGYDTSKLAMRFTYGLEGDKVSVVTESQKQTDGRYAFLFTGIAPQSMSDNIKAELIYDGVVIDTIEEYSVKDYAANIINKYTSSDVEKHQKVVRLLSDMLHYGAEAQKYLGYNTENLANAGVENILGADTNAVPENSDKGDDIAEGYTNVALAAAGVRFDYNNKVYIKFDIDGIDINTVTVLVNGNEAEIVVVDGKYTVYTKGIKANEFDNVQTFEIFAGADLVVTATYSVNSYAYSKGNGETKIAPLAKAMYYYGLAAESYSANN